MCVCNEIMEPHPVSLIDCVRVRDGIMQQHSVSCVRVRDGIMQCHTDTAIFIIPYSCQVCAAVW